MKLTIRALLALYDEHQTNEEAELRRNLTFMRVAQHADGKGYREFIEKMFGRNH